MINKSWIKEKSLELNVEFSNILSGIACERIIEIISEGNYCNELYLCNRNDFSIEAYKKASKNQIYYEYNKEIEPKLELLYLRDVLKEILKFSTDDILIEGVAEEGKIKLEIKIDNMFIPVQLIITRVTNVHLEGELEEIKLLENENTIKVMVSSKEDLLVNDFYEIIKNLELINKMDCYYDVYFILNNYPIDGRKVKDALEKKLREENIKIDQKILKTVEGYKSYIYMKKKWKVVLRQLKVSVPLWEDVINCLVKFLGPIVEAIEKGQVFLGDWMPQINRFLD